MENQPEFSVEDLEIVPLPEREAMGKIKVGPVNNNLSPRGRDSSLIDIVLNILS
jgi:hypothetical protein